MTLLSLRHTIVGLSALLIGVAAAGPTWAAERPTRVQLSATSLHRDIDALDFRALEKGLRGTEAIGILTKLVLKTRYDALVSDFREFHHAKDGSLDALRGRFDSLLGDTLELLRADDPPLFRRLERARAGLWRLLSDPSKFSGQENRFKVAKFNARKDR